VAPSLPHSVRLLGHLLDLPGTPHLVAQCPVFDVVGLAPTRIVLPPKVRVVRVAGPVAVLDPGHGLVQRPRAKVQTQVWFRLGRLTPRHELVGAKVVGLDVAPREFRARRSVLHGADPVLPVVGRAEVAARVPEHGHVQWSQSLEHVLSEALSIDQFLVRV
jgi:hypothetical protein